MSVGSAVSGFFGLVWRILEGIRRVLHLILLLVIFGFVLAALHTSIPVVPHSAALVIAPEGELVEQLASDPVRRAFGQASGGPAPETLLKDVTDAIQAAKGDARIKLIVLDVGNLSPSGLSKLQEIGTALRDFRAGGKRVVVAADSMDQTQYYLASQPARCISILSASSTSTASATTACTSRTRSTSSGVDVNVFQSGHIQEFHRSVLAQRHGAKRTRRKHGVAARRCGIHTARM